MTIAKYLPDFTSIGALMSEAREYKRANKVSKIAAQNAIANEQSYPNWDTMLRHAKPANTIITMFYRDADNYKYSYEIILEGAITKKHLAQYQSVNREGIIPHQIDPVFEHPAIYCDATNFYDEESDHVWISIFEIDEYGGCEDPKKLLTFNEANAGMSVDEFFNRIAQIENEEGWDIMDEVERCGGSFF